MVRRLSGRSSRTKHGQFLVEGPQSVRELVACRAELVRDLYVSSDRVDRYRDIYDEAHRQSLYLHTTTPEVLSAMSEDAQGIVAVARTLDTRLSSLGPVLSKACLVAVLTDVRDPGNAGTVIRAADAAGADVVILAGDSVDLMNPKVVRSSAGSLFHMPVITNASLVDVHGALKMAGIPLSGPRHMLTSHSMTSWSHKVLPVWEHHMRGCLETKHKDSALRTSPCAIRWYGFPCTDVRNR